MYDEHLDHEPPEAMPPNAYAADPAYAVAADLLESGIEISTQRAQSHGGVTEEWTRTAAIWSQLLGMPIAPHQAMTLMAANKMVRIMLAPETDHFADGMNYLALAHGVRKVLG